MSAEGFEAVVDAAFAFAGDIEHGAAFDVALAVFPCERDMHNQIDHEKGLAAFRRSPHHDEGFLGEDAVDDIEGLIGGFDVPEADKREARRFDAVTVGHRGPPGRGPRLSPARNRLSTFLVISR